MRLPLIAVAICMALVAAGCGSSSSSSSPKPNAPEKSPAGDIPDNQAYVAFTPPGANYSVKVPEGWSQTTAGGAVSFTDKLSTVRLEETAAKATPTGAGVTTVHRQAGSAVRITYLAGGKPDPVTGKTRVDAVERYLFFHKGREAVVTLSGPQGADNVDPWRTITDSLRWTR